MAPHSTAVVLQPDAHETLPALADKLAAGPVVVFVGPEGGFDSEERKTLAQAGAFPASLAPYVLRTETAALAAVAILLWSSAAD